MAKAMRLCALFLCVAVARGLDDRAAEEKPVPSAGSGEGLSLLGTAPAPASGRARRGGKKAKKSAKKRHVEMDPVACTPLENLQGQYMIDMRMHLPNPRAKRSHKFTHTP